MKSPALGIRNAIVPSQAVRPNGYTGAVLSRSLAGIVISAIDWYAFLDRPRLQFPCVESTLREAHILVTGAGGSIGSALSLELAAMRPCSLVLLDASEQALYRLQSNLASTAVNANVSTVLGNIADAAGVEEIFATHRPTLIFHAAAYKHVPLLEEQPLAAIANNALATWTLAECARRYGGPKLVLLSTDKAVDPASILGASKRIAEQITLASGGVVIRLGNVLGSAGSVVEVFLNQIQAGEPVTITDCQAERYFLTCEEAVDLLLHAAGNGLPGTLLAPRLIRVHSIAGLAEFLMAIRSQEDRLPPIFTKSRPGDKTSEALWSNTERPVASSSVDCIEIESEDIDRVILNRQLLRLEILLRQRDIAKAIEAVREMVPSYQPSATVLAIAQGTRLGVAQS